MDVCDKSEDRRAGKGDVSWLLRDYGTSSPAAGERGTRGTQKFPSLAYWGAQSKSLRGWGRSQSPEVPRVVSEEGGLGIGYSGVSKVPYQVSKPCLLLILLYLEKNSILPSIPANLTGLQHWEVSVAAWTTDAGWSHSLARLFSAFIIMILQFFFSSGVQWDELH